MAALVDAMRQEAATLEAELNADPRFLKLTHLRELIALYGDTPAKAPGAAPVQAMATQRPPRSNAGDTNRVAALEAARKLLSTATEPVKTSFLFDLLPEDVSSKIGGQSPASNLSAMMSKSPWFQSHGRRGWTLADDDDEPITSPATADDFADLDEGAPLG